MALLLCICQPPEPSMKATLLANQLSELINRAALPLVAVIVLPLAVGGYFVGRRLLARRNTRR